MGTRRILASVLIIAILVSAVVAYLFWPRPPPPPPPPKQPEGKFMAFNGLTGRPAAPTIYCNIYRQNDKGTFVQTETVLNNHSMVCYYHSYEQLYLHIWDPTDRRICHQFIQVTVPPNYEGEGQLGYGLFDIVVRIIRQPEIWELGLLDNQTMSPGQTTHLPFTVLNQEAETGYARTFDFLQNRARSAYFFVTVNTSIAYTRDQSWSVVDRGEQLTFFCGISDADLTRNLLADGQYSPIGACSIPFEIDFLVPGTYKLQYGLILNADGMYFMATGLWSNEPIERSTTFTFVTMGA